MKILVTGDAGAVSVGLAMAATALAVAPALLAGHGLAGLVADLLNIDVTTRSCSSRPRVGSRLS